MKAKNLAILPVLLALAACETMIDREAYFDPATGERLVIAGRYDPTSMAVEVMVNETEAARVELGVMSGDGTATGTYDGHPVRVECDTAVWTTGDMRCDVFIEDVWATALEYEADDTTFVYVHVPR